MTATPYKLRSGDWGVRVRGTVRAGDTVTVRTRAGKTWTARIERVVWSGDGVALCATESRSRRSSGPRECGEHHGGRCCETGGNCSSFGSGRSCGAWCCDGY